MKKLKRKEFPANHSSSDFECFGPAAEKDGVFDGTMICDLGCFTQDDKDSNKFVHACVCKSKLDSKWYLYTEWGRQVNLLRIFYSMNVSLSQRLSKSLYLTVGLKTIRGVNGSTILP